MAGFTKDHDVAKCHEAGETRRQLVCQLKCLMRTLDDCDRTGSEIDAANGGTFPPDWAVPLITYPMTRDPERYVPKLDINSKGSDTVAVMGGKYISNCACIKRNGLQADCELPECKGNPLCLVKPYPLCPPSGRGNMLVTPSEAAKIFSKLGPANGGTYLTECKEHEPCSTKCLECNASLRDICRWNPAWLNSSGQGSNPCANNAQGWWVCYPNC